MNKVIIACAGARKTTSLVQCALGHPERKVLIVTYTINNFNQIVERIYQAAGFIPSNIEVQTWFSFLLSEGVRPYQNCVYSETRIRSIAFVCGTSNKYVSKSDIKRYYLCNNDLICTDKIGDFICDVNEKSRGKVIKRLEGIYDDIYIDEIQDLAGHDLCFLELLFRSNICMYVVGDCRQATYFTNQARKNKALRGQNILNLFSSWEKHNLCCIEFRNDNYRSNQLICDFSDLLYPDLPKSQSQFTGTSNHDGVFLVRKTDVSEYIDFYNPVILKYDKRTNTCGYESYNFGASKGLTFDRVLIFPNGPISNYLSNNTPLTGDAKAKFYVGITRARYSVAIVYDNDSCHDMIQSFSTKQL